MWARNDKNIGHVPRRAKGVYALFDGSLPMYVGKGNIQIRLKQAKRSQRRKERWDRFSWYEVQNVGLIHDIEVLVLRIIPPPLRALTRQDGHFVGGKRKAPLNDAPDSISRKAVKRKTRNQ
jgi:hypothetical protein